MNLDDLSARYCIERSVLYKFIKKHLDEINSTGENAVILSGSWTFNEEAVQIIDKLRKFGQKQPGIVDRLTNQQVQERDEIIASLQAKLTAAGAEIAKLSQDKAEAYKMLADKADEIRLLESSKAEEKAELARLKERAANQAQLDAERDRRQASEIENIKQQNAAEIELLKQKNENILVKFRNELQNEQQKNEDMSFEVSKLRHELIQERRSLWEKICSIFD